MRNPPAACGTFYLILTVSTLDAIVLIERFGGYVLSYTVSRYGSISHLEEEPFVASKDRKSHKGFGCHGRPVPPPATARLNTRQE